MPDVAHLYGQDLQISASGDLLTVWGSDLGQQRVLRRLLTNPGDYIWQINYGAGLPGFVGTPANPARIAAVTRQQMYREAVVSRNPAPVIDVQVSPDGTVGEQIRYVDTTTGESQVLYVPFGG